VYFFNQYIVINVLIVLPNLLKHLSALRVKFPMNVLYKWETTNKLIPVRGQDHSENQQMQLDSNKYSFRSSDGQNVRNQLKRSNDRLSDIFCKRKMYTKQYISTATQVYDTNEDYNRTHCDVGGSTSRCVNKDNISNVSGIKSINQRNGGNISFVKRAIMVSNDYTGIPCYSDIVIIFFAIIFYIYLNILWKTAYISEYNRDENYHLFTRL